jgi:hypothetical protein
MTGHLRCCRLLCAAAVAADRRVVPEEGSASRLQPTLATLLPRSGTLNQLVEQENAAITHPFIIFYVATRKSYAKLRMRSWCTDTVWTI